MIAINKLAVLLPLAFALAPAAHAADIIVPGQNATQSGGSNQGFPFNLPTGTAQRYQQLYASNQFGSAPVTLYAIKFRQASDASGGNPFATTIPSISLALSTSQTRVGSASTVFTDNVGTDNTTVFNGSLSLSSTAAPLRNGAVQPFDIVITFSTPFTYDPRRGDLLLDVLNLSGGVTTAFDFITGGSTAVGRVVGGQGQPNATSAFFVQQGAGLVTAFATSPITAVPEPSTWALAIAGFGLIGGTMRRRGQVLSAA